MVKLHVKRNAEDLFLFDTQTANFVNTVLKSIVEIYNGYLKILRICDEMERLSNHGVFLPEEILNLEEILKKEKIKKFSILYAPKNGYENNFDSCEEKIRLRPKPEIRSLIKKSILEAQGIISKDQIKSDSCLTLNHIQEAICTLSDTVELAYPNSLPDCDPIKMEFQNQENLENTSNGKLVLNPALSSMWFAGKEMEPDKKLSDYFGKNEKSKVVVKIQPRGSCPPTREPVLSNDEKNKLMMQECKRREELKKLEEDPSVAYLDSEWADNYSLKKSFHGLKDVSWRPR